jgi:hypothetical protein
MPKKPAIPVFADNLPGWKRSMDLFNSTRSTAGTTQPPDVFSKSNYPLSPETIFLIALGEDT